MTSSKLAVRFFEVLSPLMLCSCLEGDPNPYEQVLGSGGTDTNQPALRAGVAPGVAIASGPECAQSNAVPVRLEFKNESLSTDLLVYWVDYACVENAAGTLVSGATATFDSYEGHPWRFRRLTSNELLYEYVATNMATQSVALP